MTWTKTTDTYPRDARRARLTDAAYRLHHEGLTWVNHLETGPDIDRDDLGVLSGIRPLARAEEAVAALLAAGWWRETSDGWAVVEHYGDQIEPTVLARRREADRERQRRKRAKAAGIDPETGEVLPKPEPKPEPLSRRDDPRDDRRDDPRDPGRVGTGRDGTGNYALRERAELSAVQREAAESWGDPAMVDGDPWAEAAAALRPARPVRRVAAR